MSGSLAQARRTVHFSGQVQGVGFRFTAQRMAGKFAIAGFVRNLPDGRVQLVAEGAADELDRFVRAVSARMAEHIASAEIAEGPASGEFAGFEIRN